MFDNTILMLHQAMVGAGQRHSALAANVANANTPGYRRVDVDFHEQLQRAVSSGAKGVESVAFSTETDTAGAMRADGNGVDLDREMASLAENTLEYQALVSVMRTRLRSIETAMGSR